MNYIFLKLKFILLPTYFPIFYFYQAIIQWIVSSTRTMTIAIASQLSRQEFPPSSEEQPKTLRKKSNSLGKLINKLSETCKVLKTRQWDILRHIRVTCLNTKDIKLRHKASSKTMMEVLLNSISMRPQSKQDLIWIQWIEVKTIVARNPTRRVKLVPLRRTGGMQMDLTIMA